MPNPIFSWDFQVGWNRREQIKTEMTQDVYVGNPKWGKTTGAHTLQTKSLSECLEEHKATTLVRSSSR